MDRIASEGLIDAGCVVSVRLKLGVVGRPTKSILETFGVWAISGTPAGAFGAQIT